MTQQACAPLQLPKDKNEIMAIFGRYGFTDNNSISLLCCHEFLLLVEAYCRMEQPANLWPEDDWELPESLEELARHFDWLDFRDSIGHPLTMTIPFRKLAQEYYRLKTMEKDNGKAG